MNKNTATTTATVTTMNVSIDVRDTLNAYREENGFRSLGDAIQYLLIEAGYEMPLPKLVGGLEWVNDDSAAA